jgi:3',5'-cyclic AMP phosphodiesterase CpdA
MDTTGGRRVSRRQFIGIGGAGAAALALAPGAAARGSRSRRGFEFGLVADAQYADVATAGTRHYRASLAKLDEAADVLNAYDVRFTVQVGDIIDRFEASFDAILPVYQRIRGPKYHVLGNHDYPVAAAQVLQRLGMRAPYYSFRREGWRFVVLDTNDVSLYANAPGSAKHTLAQSMLAELTAGGAVNAQTWNGAVGPEQLAWLRGELSGARRRGEPVIVIGHMPLYPVDIHNAWNDAAVTDVLERSGVVAAYFNGHNHYGNYGLRNGVHYVNFHGMVELETNAYSVVRVLPRRLEITGFGREPDRVLELDRRLALAG